MKLTVYTKEKQIVFEYIPPRRLSELLSEAGLFVEEPCGGRGQCGKCKAVVTGEVTPPDDAECRLLTDAERKNGVRLLCRTTALGHLCVDYNQADSKMQGVTAGKIREFSMNPCLETGYGMAFDIGTTTVAGYLYEFPSGRQIAALCEENRQAAHGADVISRITYSESGGKETLTQEINQQIEAMKHRLAGEREIGMTVVTGNTTMLHFYRGLDASGIAKAPFTPRSLFGEWQDDTYLPRCMDAYVGADITTAIIASGMTDRQTAFLVDIGTNGEMAVWRNGTLYACSTAAGPALEGAGISQGMTAKPGAISKVWQENGKLCYETIDRKEPIGICGTGLIDAVYVMRSMDILDESGYLEEAFPIGESGVSITPADVRQVQLAKAAIAAGIRTLLAECGISANDLDAFYIAGGFGSYIRPESAAGIGLIPREVVPKTVILGNAAGNGAGMLLQNKAFIEESNRLAQEAHTLSLAESPMFMEAYMEEMSFA